MKPTMQAPPSGAGAIAAGQGPAGASAPSVLAAVVADLARALDAAGVPHAFLRGLDAYPELGPGSDVDLCVRPRDVPAFTRALEASCARRGAVIHERFRAGFLAQFHLYAREGTGRHRFLTVDVHTAEAALGVPFLEAGELLSERRDPHGFRVPEEDVSALANFLTPYLSGGAVVGRYAGGLAAVLAAGGARVRNLAGRLFGVREGEALCEEILAGDHGALRRRARRRRRALLARRLLRAPLRSSLAFLAFALSLIHI